MLLEKLISFLERLEDPRHPLLGPNIKGLYLFGIWQTNSTRKRNCIYNIIHCTTILFVLTQFVDLYRQLDDVNKALNNLSMTFIGVISCAKCWSYVLRQPQWQKLAADISDEELASMKENDETVMIKMKEYKLYSRVITYLYWVLVTMTDTALIVTPLLKYLTTSTYRANIRDGVEEYPQIMSCWFPFDYMTMPGYMVSCVIQIVMSIQGSGIIAASDANAITIMTFMKGQMQILKAKCVKLFENLNGNPEEFSRRVMECHRHHTFLVKQSEVFDKLLSPVMFIYVLICSMSICCSVVQFFSSGATAAQKLWVIQYTSAQIAQLFLFCWHGNEVFVESKDVDQGVYESDWWKANPRMRKQVLLLAGKLNRPILYTAGPFSRLTVPTFISIIKGSYSFFTLFAQMQEEN
ncbi:odorant receptor Or2-like [Ostrinia nubilalis]|uniref:odorant receptor Or2-like n=1 Tax=Ostrinia nubilalis TaxID=29057 RepID=UPI0030826AA2